MQLDRFLVLTNKCYFKPEDGWTSSGIYIPSTIFQSFRDDGRMIVIGSVQGLNIFGLTLPEKSVMKILNF